jgi:hypothetical protein
VESMKQFLIRLFLGSKIWRKKGDYIWGVLLEVRGRLCRILGATVFFSNRRRTNCRRSTSWVHERRKLLLHCFFFGGSQIYWLPSYCSLTEIHLAIK